MKAKILIFKCKQCGEIFLGSKPKDRESPIFTEHIGRYANSIVDTHKCNEDTYGVGELIGAYHR